jgi:hypothetical protein
MARNVRRSIEIVKRGKFVRRMMIELAGDAEIMLCGDVAGCQFPPYLHVTPTPTGIGTSSMTRASGWLLRIVFGDMLSQRTVKLRLTHETVDEIWKRMLIVGFKQTFLDVVITRGGVVEFYSHDYFDPHCVYVGPGVPVAFLEQLKSEWIIRSYESLPDDPS